MVINDAGNTGLLTDGAMSGGFKMGGFQSGQMGQTVNLLAKPSQVRILLSPLEEAVIRPALDSVDKLQRREDFCWTKCREISGLKCQKAIGVLAKIVTFTDWRKILTLPKVICQGGAVPGFKDGHSSMVGKKG